MLVGAVASSKLPNVLGKGVLLTMLTNNCPVAASWTTVSPNCVLITGAVSVNYIKKPTDPHWGYNTINSDPIYNSDSTVDFEISAEDEADLIIKICKYSGLSIRESDIVQVTSQQEQLEYQKENS